MVGTLDISFEDGQCVKLTASHRDLLLILGIVVALIISFTKWLHHANQIVSDYTSPFTKNQLVSG